MFKLTAIAFGGANKVEKQTNTITMCFSACSVMESLSTLCSKATEASGHFRVRVWASSTHNALLPFHNKSLPV